MRALLRDPPLIDRLTWREGIHPQTLISEDRGLMARTFGTLLLVGVVVGVAILLIGEQGDRQTALLSATLALSTIVGVTCFVGYRRLPVGFFHGVVALGTLMITGAVAGAPAGAEAVYGFFYVWIVFVAFLFWPPLTASCHAAFAAACFGAVLFADDTSFGLELVLAATATIGTTGAMMGILRARVEQIASGFATEAHTDPVTAIANRRGFDEGFAREIDRSRRTGRPLSLVICDLDRFKQVNDAMGHEEGDIALRRAASAIAGAVRAGDSVARLGGEEFAVILPDTDREPARHVAERMRLAVRGEFDTYDVRLTASCGIACTKQVDGGGEQLFRAADSALYAAKREGRDCTVAYDRHGSEPPPAAG
jgi:diguanylate cyclase (GGDEF)-like protein